MAVVIIMQEFYNLQYIQENKLEQKLMTQNNI